MLRALRLLATSLAIVLMLSSYSQMQAQTCPSGWAHVSASLIQSVGRGASAPTLLSSGTFTVTAEDANYQPTSFGVPGGGIALAQAKTVPVVNGAIAQTLCVPRSSYANPAIKYDIQVRDTSPTGGNAVFIHFTGVTIDLPEWSFDSYVPSVPTTTTPAGTYQHASGPPSGGCTAPDWYVDDASYKLYICSAGTWHLPQSDGASTNDFPLTLGSTPVAANSTVLSLNGITVNGVTPQTMGFLDATSSVQTQLNSKLPMASDGSINTGGNITANNGAGIVTGRTGTFNGFAGVNALNVAAFGGGYYGVTVDGSGNAVFNRSLTAYQASSFGSGTPTTIASNGALSAPSISSTGIVSGATVSGATLQGSLSSNYLLQGTRNFYDQSYNSMGYEALNPGTNGIPEAVTALGGAGGDVLVPYNEYVLDHLPTADLVPLQTMIEDRRNGQLYLDFYDAGWDGYGNPTAFQVYCNYKTADGDSGMTGNGTNPGNTCLSFYGDSQMVGTSMGTNGFGWTPWTNTNGLTTSFNNHSNSHFQPFGFYANDYSPGDFNFLDMACSTKGGTVEASGEGVNCIREQPNEIDETSSTVVSTATNSSGQVLLTVANANGASQDQDVLDSTQAITDVQTKVALPAGITSSSVVLSRMGVAQLATYSATAHACGTLNATISTPRVPDGGTTSESFTLTPFNSDVFASTGYLVFSGVDDNFESVQIASNPGTNSYTALFEQPHQAGEIVCQGGLAGEALEQTDVDASVGAGHHYVFHVIGNLTSSIVLYGAFEGGPGNYGNTYNFNGPVKIFPMAHIVASPQPNSNTLTVQPTSTNWAANDAVIFPNNISLGYMGLRQNNNFYNPYMGFTGIQTIVPNGVIDDTVAFGYSISTGGPWAPTNMKYQSTDSGSKQFFYAPLALYIGASNGQNQYFADGVLMQNLPVGGSFDGNPLPRCVICVGGEWPANSIFTDGVTDYNFVGDMTDNAYLSYVHTGAKGVGTLTWNGPFAANSLSIGGTKTGPLATASSSTATITPGANVTSVACASSTCTNLRGTLTVAGGTATTGTIATLSWPATTTAYACQASQNGGATWYGIGNSLATTTSFNITADASVSGATVTVSYACQP